MKKKSIVALLLAIVMCFSLCACGGASGQSTADLIDYIVENGHESNLNIPYEKIESIETSGEEYTLSVYSSESNDTYDKVVIESEEVDGGYVYYKQLVVDVNTFAFEYNSRTDYSEEAVYKTYEFETYYQLKANAKEYTNEADFDVKKVNFKTGKIEDDTMYQSGMNKGLDTLLEELDAYMKEIGFSIATLGFESYVIETEEPEEDSKDSKKMNDKKLEEAITGAIITVAALECESKYADVKGVLPEIATIEDDGNGNYTVYGKIIVNDIYNDKYEGKFQALVYIDDEGVADCKNFILDTPEKVD